MSAVAAVGFLLGGITGVWALRTATNEQWGERQVAAVLGEPEVRDSLARSLVAEFDAAVDLDERINSLLPDSLASAALVLEAAVTDQMERRVSEAIGSEAAIEVAAGVISHTQTGAVALLTGNGTIEGVNLETGEVRVSLLPLVPRVIEAGQRFGLFTQVVVPDLSGMTRSEQLEALSESLGRPLDDEFAYPVVFRSEAVSEAGRTLDTLRRITFWVRSLAWFLLIAGVAFAAAAVWLSNRRDRAVLWLGLGLVGVLAVARWLVGVALGQLPNVTDNAGGRVAISRMADGALAELTYWFVAVGLLTAVIVGLVWALEHRPRAGAAAMGEG